MSFLLSISINLSIAQTADPAGIAPPENTVPENLIQIHRAIVADKSTRTLSLWEDKDGTPKLHAYYPMDFGKDPGDKLTEGDHRTPNGIYFPQRRMEKNELNFDEYGIRAFTLDYPNYFDVLKNKSGSGIWIHSIPPQLSLLRGSRGCVVVRIDTIEAITPFIELGKTAVIISDQVHYMPIGQYKNQNQELTKWVDAWKANWESKNIDQYISYYADDFKSQKMNKKTWKKYKQSLNKRYEKISVQLSDLNIVKNNDQILVRFKQKYQSDAINDTGLKTLYSTIQSGQPKILSEIWQSLQSSADEVARSLTENSKNQN